MTETEKNTAATSPSAQQASSEATMQQEVYPPAKSSYYFGPPSSDRAFGEGVTGKVGEHVPKEIVRYVLTL